MEELFLDYMPKEGEEVLILHAEFTPLQLDTMTTEDIMKMDVSYMSVCVCVSPRACAQASKLLLFSYVDESTVVLYYSL